MKVDIEEVTPCTKQLKIEVPFEEYTKEEDKAYSELSKKVKMPGFRKGKVPRQYLKKIYNTQVKSDVLNKIIPEFYHKVVEEKGLKPVGAPKLENIISEKDSPITFTAIIDIIPPFEIKDYKELKIEKKIVKIVDEDIEKELNYIKERYATFEEVVDRPTKENDLVVIDFKGFINDNPLKGGEAKNYPLVIGSNSLPEEFEKGCIGLSNNEEKDILVTYPSDNLNKELANKKVLFKIKVNEIKIKILPEINDKFIKQEMGKDMVVTELKDEIRQHQEKREELIAESNLRKDLMNKLVEMNAIEIPQALIEDQINFMVEEFKQRMRLSRGKEEPKIDREIFRKEAILVIKGELIQRKISEMEKIESSEKEIEEELSKIALEKKMDVKKVKISMQKDDSYNDFLIKLQREKTMDSILSKLNIQEVVVDRSELDKPIQ